MEKTYRLTLTTKEIGIIATALSKERHALCEEWLATDQKVIDMPTQDCSNGEMEDAQNTADRKYIEYRFTSELDKKVWEKYMKSLYADINACKNELHH